jgi:FkbM family methyltransferase
MVSRALVDFYLLWHGRLHRRGAGWLLGHAARKLAGLRRFPLRLPEGQTIHLDFRDISSVYWLNHLCGDRFEEEALCLALLARINAASVVWDVGANCGLFSYHLARSGKPSRVIFFEPNPAVFRLASDALRPFRFMEGKNCALSDRDGTGFLQVAAGGSPTAHLVPQSGDSNVVEISLFRGDSLVHSGDLPPPTAIKIDTEGHECAVLKGLADTIRLYRPLVCLEHICLSDEQVAKALPRGYSIRTIRDSDASLCEGFVREAGHNSMLLPKE